MIDLIVRLLQVAAFGFLAYGFGLVISQSRTLIAIGERRFAHRAARWSARADRARPA